ncbi:MAG: motility associated factor glycosyltransferase family protein [Lachnospiraceae bacterium]|nr:motility associated factor glycosyltransferase family protein [Lachnospiraceae bacterium]
MKEMLKKNYEKLIETQKKFDLKIEAYKDYQDFDEYKYVSDGKEWNLFSEVDMDRAVDAWMEQFDKVQYDTILLLFGIGHYKYLNSLRSRFPDNAIIVYEPSEEMMIKFLAHKEAEYFLEDNQNFHFILGGKRKADFSELMSALVATNTKDKICIANIPNYSKIFSDDFMFFYKIINERYEMVQVNEKTLIEQGAERVGNIIYNMRHMVDESGLDELKVAMENLETEDCTVVLIAAGPSLDKNIRELKEYKNKVFIVCVDAALNTAVKNDIIPDLIVSVDPYVYTKAIESDSIIGVPLVADLVSNPKLLEVHKGRVFYQCSNADYPRRVMRDYGAELLNMPHGGSVANVAFSLLLFMGFKRIVFIGQDLAYPGNQFHAKDAFENEGELDLNDNKYFYVESIDGGKVLTETNMNVYRKFFENHIKRHPDCTFIDATEGGAFIEGTEIMTLREALDGCDNLDGIGFTELINNANYWLDDEQKESVLDEMRSSYENINAQTNKMRNMISVYKKLGKLLKEEKYCSKEFAKNYKKVTAFNEYVENNRDVMLLELFTNGALVECFNSLSEYGETHKEEIDIIINSGLNMIKGYIDAGEELKEVWKETCDKYKLQF